MPDMEDAVTQLRAWIDAHAVVMLLCWTALGACGLWRVRAYQQPRRLLAVGAQSATVSPTSPPSVPPPLPRALRRDVLSVAIVVGAAAFAALAVSVTAESSAGPLLRGDLAVVAWMRAALGLPVLQALSAFTAVGSLPVMAAVGAVVAVALLARRQWLLACVWIFGTVGNGLLVRAAKQAFGRARPEHLHGITTEAGFSFPSGHAAGSTVVYGLLAYLLLLWCAPRWRPAVLVIAALWVLTIGASRVMLQVHYLSDVLAGFLMGLTWLLLVVGTAERARRW